MERLTPERRRQMTRDHLLAAAAETFAAKGYEAASLDEIADAAGFTKGAIYSNFGSKEALLLAVVDQRQARIGAAWESIVSKPDAELTSMWSLAPTAAEWALWEEFVLYSRGRPELAEQLRDHDRAAFARIEEFVANRCQALGVEPPLPVADLARLHVLVFDGLARQRVLDPDSVSVGTLQRISQFIDAAVKETGRPRRSGTKQSAPT